MGKGPTTAALFALGALMLTMLGCAPNQQIRTNFDPAGGDRTTAVIDVQPEYKLGFVEFDDQGWFWDPKQCVAVEQMIRAEAGLGAGGQPQGIVLVAFVHGWKNNAGEASDSVGAMREILRQLNEAEQAQHRHPPRKVVGVYVGWRGLSAKWEPFKELSFWTRKSAAHKVGGYGALTKLLVDLENVQKESLASLPPHVPRTELIIIGHSFGGAAVYSALGQILTERFVNTVGRQPPQRLTPLGDQVILLNPAFEAQRHYDLDQMATDPSQRYAGDQRPVLTIFTSQGDWATHYAFPVGRFFSTLFDLNRSGAQRQAGLNTVGWYKPFVTHELVYTPKTSQPPMAAAATTAEATTRPAMPTSTLNLATKRHEFHDRGRLQASGDNVEVQRGKWRPNSGTPQVYHFDDADLKPVDGFKPGDPFLVVSVDPRIMKDHGDIDNTVLINFLREYIHFCQVETTEHKK